MSKFQVILTEGKHKKSYVQRVRLLNMIDPVKTANLTIEQQFQLQILKKDIENMNLDQAKEYLLEAFRQMMVKDNLVKDLFKNGNGFL